MTQLNDMDYCTHLTTQCHASIKQASKLLENISGSSRVEMPLLSEGILLQKWYGTFAHCSTALAWDHWDCQTREGRGAGVSL